MVWTAPRTWASGETLTAANLNAHVRDNLLWLGGTGGRVVQALSGESTVSENTTSGSPSQLVAPTVTITITTGDLLIYASAALSNSGSGAACALYVQANSLGWAKVGKFISTGAGAAQTLSSFRRLAAPGAGTYVVQMGWSTSTGTLSVETDTLRELTVLEVR
jgi:hypothetical protein